jgi:hypothetical protein
MGYRSESEVTRAAYLWWIEKRPNGWTEGKHLNCPWANCTTDYERELALNVAEWAASKLLQQLELS